MMPDGTPTPIAHALAARSTVAVRQQHSGCRSAFRIVVFGWIGRVVFFLI
jgi:hypothetical protein